MRKFLNKDGYTLIEVIISMAIFSVVLVMITGFYINFIKFSNNIETNSLANTNIINTLNYIKYSVDQTTYLEIVSKDDILKNKNKNYKYIMIDNGKILSGRLTEEDSSVILNKDDIKSNINLKFKKSNKNVSDLIVELNIEGMNKPLISYINIQNMQYNNISIKGDDNVAIIFKDE
ncbi:prepilin-type N-terminal cleavage/methylation domain-containing protein [uncultured Tyzzerella sp.]|uniref:prepilin-type N-terminal cleavage/methylation domain-containing protein n=1 Tax=uncultured Tyzzerella sp. TaxID=2321398 RepID=UPI0029421283|nr:prepilin-type N-terminal cleavage/methylation domain-containing protein [uncultured Tyzzerella sp.]